MTRDLCICLLGGHWRCVLCEVYLFLFLQNIWTSTKQWFVFYFCFYLSWIILSILRFLFCFILFFWKTWCTQCSCINENRPVGSWLNYLLRSSAGQNFLCTVFVLKQKESGRTSGYIRALRFTEIIYVVKGQLLRFQFGIQKSAEEGKSLAHKTFPPHS